jgi:hypothetical protein
VVSTTDKREHVRIEFVGFNLGKPVRTAGVNLQSGVLGDACRQNACCNPSLAVAPCRLKP